MSDGSDRCSTGSTITNLPEKDDSKAHTLACPNNRRFSWIENTSSAVINKMTKENKDRAQHLSPGAIFARPRCPPFAKSPGAHSAEHWSISTSTGSRLTHSAQSA